jgi:hypothetical protein
MTLRELIDKLSDLTNVVPAATDVTVEGPGGDEGPIGWIEVVIPGDPGEQATIKIASPA